MKKYEKQTVAGISIGTYPVYCNDIYHGREPMKVVGIRQNEIELEGDYSGGTHNVTQSSWFPIKECFVIVKNCDQMMKPGGCQIHNVNCCGGSTVITEHVNHWL